MTGEDILLLLFGFWCFVRCHSGQSCGWFGVSVMKSSTERRAAEAAALLHCRHCSLGRWSESR